VTVTDSYPTSAALSPGQSITPFQHLAVADTVTTETKTISATVTVPVGYAVTASAGLTGGNGSYTVTGTAPPLGTVSITDTTDPRSMTIPQTQSVQPFAHIPLSDTIPDEQLTVALGLTGVTASGDTATGLYQNLPTISGTAAQLQAILQGITITNGGGLPTSGQAGVYASGAAPG
jgi:hypothetical protein